MPTLDAPRKSNRSARGWTWPNPYRSTICEQCGAKQPRRPFRKPYAWCWKCQELLDSQQVLLGEAGTMVLEWRALAKHADPVTKLVGMIVLLAVADGAEEITFEPTDDELLVSFLVDQVAYELIPPPSELCNPIAQVLRAISKLDPHASGPQTGQFNILLESTGNVIQVAVARFAPTEFGERVTIQLQRDCCLTAELRRKVGLHFEELLKQSADPIELDTTPGGNP